MMAAVLALVWRQVPSVHELTQVLAREDLLWCRAVKVSQQALSQRFLEFPAELIEDSFNLVKRLLGLRYLWTGSVNGIRLQVWATWIIYAPG